MRSLSYYLRQQKNVPFQDEPFIMLMELDKTGWYRLRYKMLSAAFSEEATLSGAGGTARIVFVEEDTATTGSLIIEPISGSGIWTANGVISDDYGGSARTDTLLNTNETSGMTFHFARYLEDVIYKGIAYQAFPCSVGTTQYGSEKFPTVDIVIGNPDRIPEAWARKANGFLNERVRIQLVWAGDL